MNEMTILRELGADLHPGHGPSLQTQSRALTVTTQPTARANRVRPMLAAAGGFATIAVAAAVVAGVVTAPSGTDGGPPPGGATAVEPVAFTVRTNDDGSVTFTARDLVDPDAATRALNQAGIAGRVVNMPTDGCASGSIKQEDIDDKYWVMKDHVGWPNGVESITIRSSDYRPGGGLLVGIQVVRKKTADRVGVGVLALPYTDVRTIPTCVGPGGLLVLRAPQLAPIPTPTPK